MNFPVFTDFCSYININLYMEVTEKILRELKFMNRILLLFLIDLKQLID